MIEDYLNRLTQDVVSSTTSTYAYDMSNERIKEVVASATSTVTTYYPTKFYNITAGVPTKHVFANGVVIATLTGTTTGVVTPYRSYNQMTATDREIFQMLSP